MKYTIRKLVFLLVLAALIASPFAVAEYKSIHTDDPFILAAREIERDFLPGEIDVLIAFEPPDKPNMFSILVYIPNFPDWSEHTRENFKRFVLQIVRNTEYDITDIAVGWDFPPEKMRIQGLWVCEKLRTADCKWFGELGMRVPPKFVKWPGIGEP